MPAYTDDMLGMARAIQEVLIKEIDAAFSVAPQDVIRKFTPTDLLDLALAHAAEVGEKGRCDCACPDACSHSWDGPFEDHQLEGSVTCSKCRMWKMDHDMVVGP